MQEVSVIGKHDGSSGVVGVIMGPHISLRTGLLSSWWGDNITRPSALQIDPERVGFCAVHALRNAMQDHGGHLITDSLLVRGAEVAAHFLGDCVSEHYDIHRGGNFSIGAMMAAAGLVENFSLHLLNLHKHIVHNASAEEFALEAFADVENNEVVGLVVHRRERRHYVALIRNGDHFPSEMLLLDSLRPHTVELVTAESFKGFLAGKPGYTVLQCMSGKLRE